VTLHAAKAVQEQVCDTLLGFVPDSTSTDGTCVSRLSNLTTRDCLSFRIWMQINACMLSSASMWITVYDKHDRSVLSLLAQLCDVSRGYQGLTTDAAAECVRTTWECVYPLSRYICMMDAVAFPSKTTNAQLSVCFWLLYNGRLQPKRECDVSKGFTAGDVSDFNTCVRPP
jgi:hypothetical protein